MLRCLIKSLIRPHVEYASTVWSPFKKGEIKLREGVQQRASKLVPELRNMTYPERLRKLGLPTLEFRRKMIQVYKILTGREDIDGSQFMTKSETDLRGHSQKLFKYRSRLLIRKNSFANRVVDVWNRRPEHVVSAPSVNAFKSGYKLHTASDPAKFCPDWYRPSLRPKIRLVR